MHLEKKPSPEEVDIPKPFDPNDSQRIAELNAKFEGGKSEQEIIEQVK